MATAFTVGKGNFIRPYRNVKIRPFKEAASQTFIVGNLLILQTSSDKGNQVKVAGADPTTGLAVGIAMAAASGTENTEIPVAVFDGASEFVVHIQDAATLDADDIGDEFGFVADATNLIHRLDNTETTSKVFRVLDFGPKPDGSGGMCGHGDTNGTYIVKSAASGQAVYRP